MNARLGYVVEYPCEGCGVTLQFVAISDPEQNITTAWGNSEAQFWCAPCWSTLVKDDQ